MPLPSKVPRPCFDARLRGKRTRKGPAAGVAGRSRGGRRALLALAIGIAWLAPGTASPADELACRAGLSARGVRAYPLPEIADGTCGAPVPMRLTGVRGVAVARPATVTCAVADALDRWTAEVVVPEANRFLGEAPTRILIGASYQCRTRNRVPGARMSEHAYANAIDVHGFAFAGRPDLVIGSTAGAATAESRFLAAIRGRACGYFTTVLGPGSDAAHAGHLHLDMRRRSGDYRICQ